MADVKKCIRKICISAGCMIFAVIFTVLQPVFAHAYETVENQDKVSVSFTLPNGFSYEINAYSKAVEKNFATEDSLYGDTAYIVTLPYTLKDVPVELKSRNNAVFCIGDKEYADGQKTVLEAGSGLLVYENGDKYIFEVMYTSDIPQIYIDTPSGSLDYIHESKENFEEGKITITDGTEIEYTGDLEYIKGRGNTSWSEDQKPYSIKLRGKASLFGMDASKKYSLLAPALDGTFIKNKSVYDLADRMGIPFCTQAQFADLYCNNEYIGLYLLTEKVEADDGRVEIFDLDTVNEQSNPGVIFEECAKIEEEYETDSAIGVGGYRCYDIPNDMSKGVNGGYLLELEFYQRYKYYWVDAGFISDYGQTVAISSPQYISKLQMEYIKDYYQQFEDAVLSADGYNSLGKYYTEYIDIEAAAKMYVLQEFVQNIDVGISSCFIYKNFNGKLVMCSPWDFDRALGIRAARDGINLADTDNIWVADRTLDGDAVNIPGREPTYTIFSLLWMHEDFRQEAVKQWKEAFMPQRKWLDQMTADLADCIYDSAAAEESRWNQDSYTQQADTQKIYTSKIEELHNFMEGRINFLDKFFVSEGTGVFYGGNGAVGAIVDPVIYAAGSSAVVQENKYINQGYSFAGWNTKPDGSGDWYYPGDSIEISSENIYLFAQWDGYTSNYVYQDPPVKSKTLLEILIGFFDNII